MKYKQLDLEFLRQKRLEKGYTLQEMADKVGFKTGANYLKYEQGHYSMDANMLAKVAGIFGVGISKFFK